MKPDFQPAPGADAWQLSNPPILAMAPLRAALQSFEDVGMQTFGLKDRFYPTLPPDPATLAVRVEGAPCSSGWTWNAATNSVVFAEGASCYPQHNQSVELEYDVFCAAPAP